MQTVVLAGGLGTRMLPETLVVPKTMLSVAGHPFAHWQLQWLAAQGVDDVLYSVGHLGDQVRSFVGDGSRYGLRVSWVEDGDVLLGTAGALRKALDEGKLEDRFILTYGDSYLRLDLGAVVGSHANSGRPALMTVFRNNHSFDASNVVFADGIVSLYDKELGRSPSPPTGMRWIDYGLSVLESSLIEQQVVGGQTADLAPIFQTLSLSGQLAGFEVESRFYEVGSPEGRHELEAYLSAHRTTILSGQPIP